MMNCFTLATGTPSPPGSESGSSRRGEGPTSPPRRRASPSALSARPSSWRSSVPWPWSPRGAGSSWPRTRAPRPCGSRRGTCRRGRPCATPRSRATGAGGRGAGACVEFSEESRRWRGDEVIIHAGGRVSRALAMRSSQPTKRPYGCSVKYTLPGRGYTDRDTVIHFLRLVIFQTSW